MVAEIARTAISVEIARTAFDRPRHLDPRLVAEIARTAADSRTTCASRMPYARRTGPVPRARPLSPPPAEPSTPYRPLLASTTHVVPARCPARRQRGPSRGGTPRNFPPPRAPCRSGPRHPAARLDAPARPPRSRCDGPRGVTGATAADLDGHDAHAVDEEHARDELHPCRKIFFSYSICFWKASGASAFQIRTFHTRALTSARSAYRRQSTLL